MIAETTSRQAKAMIVTLSGSLSIHRLPPAVTEKLDTIIALGAHIHVGDAPGADTLLQRHLSQRGYRNVTVWYRDPLPRNNVGGWSTRKVKGTYTARDRAMHADADFGLAVWDGRSPGTARNIQQLGRRMRVVRV